ncbi:MAG: GNAT family N-acetyltransferase [Bacteroidota bacterium]
MATTPFVPRDFKVPKKLETERLRLRMLKITDAVKDFDAVISSTEYLLNTKPFGPGQRWPTGLTLEQNMIDLGWHHKEFQMKTSFAYTVMNHEESQCLGCIYIEPTIKPGFDAKVYLWVRQSELDTGLDDHLFQAVKQWIAKKWPFETVAYPGRNISWEDWRQ